MKFQIGSFVNHGKKKPRLCLLYMHECMYKNSFCDQKTTKYKTSVIDPCVIGLVIVTSPGPRLV